MADIAMVFHWPPSEMYAMEINELMRWHEKAISRWNLQHPHQSEAMNAKKT